jgi:hypothetical protein
MTAHHDMHGANCTILGASLLLGLLLEDTAMRCVGYSSVDGLFLLTALLGAGLALASGLGLLNEDRR